MERLTLGRIVRAAGERGWSVRIEPPTVEDQRWRVQLWGTRGDVDKVYEELHGHLEQAAFMALAAAVEKASGVR